MLGIFHRIFCDGIGLSERQQGLVLPRRRSVQVKQPVFVLSLPPWFVRMLLAGARGAEAPYMSSLESERDRMEGMRAGSIEVHLRTLGKSLASPPTSILLGEPSLWYSSPTSNLDRSLSHGIAELLVKVSRKLLGLSATDLG